MIEQFLYGMFQGKISLLKTDGVNKILSDKNFQILRNLKMEDSDKYLWLPTEQIVALPRIVNVEDSNGRSWVQNHTILIPIHEYIQQTDPKKIFSKFFLPPLEEIPKNLEPIKVNNDE